MPHATSKCESFSEFLRLHKDQLQASAVPEIYWKTLFHKLKTEMYDAGEYFMMQRVQQCYEDEEDMDEEVEEHDPNDANGVDHVEDKTGDYGVDEGVTQARTDYTWQVVVVNEEGILKSEPSNIYLVDHAWTYRVEQARKQLKEMPDLLQRMVAMMEVEVEDLHVETVVDNVLQAMWKYNQTYSIGNAELGSEDASPIWYIMDEFGSRIQHGDDPTVKMVPFCYVPSQISYTIMWPLKDMLSGAEVTRDYVDGETDMLRRKLRLLPWIPADMTHLSFDLKEPEEAFFRKYRVHETLPNLEVDFKELPRDRNICVYTDIDQVADNLTDDRFEIVNSAEAADILWSSKSMKDFQALSENSPGCMVNQFPFEMVITIKNLLAVAARRKAEKHINHDTLHSSPDWLPVTFNLASELSQFVSYFQHRDEMDMNNYWICKPWNLARALDTHITNNLDYILRLPDTGPKIASLYVDDPVLIERETIGQVKFDLRFVVLLLSVEPLKLGICRQFLIRYGNIPFSMDSFDEYEKHFTVMNYKAGAKMNEVFCEDFIESFNDQYPSFSWEDERTGIYQVIKELFEAATCKPPPLGIGHSPQSRAMYGVDVMLKWKMDEKGTRKMCPVVFECNYGPDNTRLCRYYPSFMNDVFSTLFFNDTEGREVDLL